MAQLVWNHEIVLRNLYILEGFRHLQLIVVVYPMVQGGNKVA